jgi:hypothetical protein
MPHEETLPAFEPGSFCPKCGGGDLNIAYHPSYPCETSRTHPYGWIPAWPLEDNPSLRWMEHLCIACGGCGYQWYAATMEPGS